MFLTEEMVRVYQESLREPPVSGTLALQRPVSYEHLGYGTFGFNLEQGLRRAGLGVVVPQSMQINWQDYHRPPKNIQTVVWTAQPAHSTGCWAGQFTVIYTMWESDRLPEAFVSNIHNYDLVVVPNQQNREMFSQHHPNVVKVPLGYDESWWNLSRGIRELPQKTFNFLLGAAGAREKARKGVDLAIQAFEYAFPNWHDLTPSPRLVVKCLKMPPEPKDFLKVHVGRWDLSKLVDLYFDCHAMVLPSRGEGWGYHPLQAVATGMPAIVSAIPGHQEYSWLPGFVEVPVTKEPAARFLQGNGGNWWEPDLDVLVGAMRHVYDNYQVYQQEALHTAEHLADLYGREVMARRLIRAIGPERLTQNPTGDWKPYTERLYPVEVNRYLGRGECDVGGTEHVLTPGARQWLSANVRLVLDEAGYLANSDEVHPGILP